MSNVMSGESHGLLSTCPVQSSRSSIITCHSRPLQPQRCRCPPIDCSSFANMITTGRACTVIV